MYLITPHFSSFHDGDCNAAEAYWHELVGEEDGLTHDLCLGTEYTRQL